jgi:hypothetical protein
MLNDVLKTRFVAILIRFVGGRNGPIRRDARVSAGFAKRKYRKVEKAKFFRAGDGWNQPVVVGRNRPDSSWTGVLP